MSAHSSGGSPWSSLTSSDAWAFPWPVEEPFVVDPETGYPSKEVGDHSAQLHTSLPITVVHFHIVQQCDRNGWATYQFSESTNAAYQSIYNNTNGNIKNAQ